MIEQVLAEIRAAEEKAALIIEEANAKAKEIAQNSAAECEAQKKAEAAAQELVRNAQKNVRGAGEWIAENIIKGKI